MPMQRDDVIAALRTIQDPELFKDIVALNAVTGLHIEGDDVSVRIDLKSPNSPLRPTIQRDVETALQRIGVKKVTVELAGAARPAGHPAGTIPVGGGGAKSTSALPQVRHVIAVGAGKGGVGKSTVAANIAVGLSRAGAAVGLMDGDIYGPSMPTMLGIKGVAPEVRGPKIVPHYVHGVHAITIGSLVEQDKPLIWRGPMAHGAFKQLLLDNTEWPALDYLIVDLPPGTGDVPLTLCQMLPLTGAVIVATPQQVALDDAVRAVRMFEQLQTPILGLVENMSYFVAPDGSEHDIFGRGGTERAAQRLGLPYLGGIPMFTELRVNSDAGRPNSNFEGDAKLKSSLEGVIYLLKAEVEKRSQQPPGPKLTIS